jgi:hypothetical protein
MPTRSLNQRLSQIPAVSRGREIVGILVLALALFIGLSLFSLLFGSGKLMGPAGARLGLVVYAGLGIAGYVVAWALVMLAARLWTGKSVGLLKLENAGYLGLMISAAVLLHTALGAYRLDGHSPGGIVGEYLGHVLDEVQARPRYLVDERVNFPDSNDRAPHEPATAERER